MEWLSKLFVGSSTEITTRKQLREAFFSSVKDYNDEAAKPAAERDEARLLELGKRKLRLQRQSCQASRGQDASGRLPAVLVAVAAVGGAFVGGSRTPPYAFCPVQPGNGATASACST